MISKVYVPKIAILSCATDYLDPIGLFRICGPQLTNIIEINRASNFNFIIIYLKLSPLLLYPFLVRMLLLQNKVRRSLQKLLLQNPVFYRSDPEL